MERIGGICISASLINPRIFFFFLNCDKGGGKSCISEKTKVPFSTHDLIHFCNSYFICSMNLAPFKRHINHASSCCFGWQPFFLEIFPIARARIRHLWQERHLKAGEFQIGKVYIDIDVFGESCEQLHQQFE